MRRGALMAAAYFSCKIHDKKEGLTRLDDEGGQEEALRNRGERSLRYTILIKHVAMT